MSQCQEVRPGLMEVRVTLHSSLSSWDERSAQANKSESRWTSEWIERGEGGKCIRKILQTKRKAKNVSAAFKEKGE